MKKSAYLIGIKGVGMTALAVYLKEKGYVVTGSDTSDVFATDSILKKFGIGIKKGFTRENIEKKYDLVVTTGAWGGMTNPEAKRAIELGLPTYPHGKAVGLLSQDACGISVAGCHGKTTTSALIASLLTSAGLKPSYIIGTAQINNLGQPGHFGGGKYIVLEADEYMTCPVTDKTPRFLWQHPRILVMTNIEYDHPDAFANIEDVKDAFVRLTENVSDEGIIIACCDSKEIQDILPRIKRKVITYGFSPQADYRIEKCYFGSCVSFMHVVQGNIALGEYMLRISGKHNLLNALAAGIAANYVGISWDKIKEYLKVFAGTKRRFEKICEVGTMLLYDDYAHHPSEIVATVRASKEWFPDKRVVVLFQPHTFSRTKALFIEFAKSFKGADLTVITDIYPSGREQFDKTISSEMLVAAAKKYTKNVTYQGNKKEVLKFLKENISDNDLLLTMGAGDIFLLHQDIEKLMRESRRQPRKKSL